MLTFSCVGSQEDLWFLSPREPLLTTLIEYSECDYCTSVLNSLGLRKPLCLGRICLRMGLPCTSKSLQEVGKSQDVLHYLD